MKKYLIQFAGMSAKWLCGLAGLSALILMAACNQQSRGFVLPEGDVAKGKELYVSMSCNQCHSIADIEWAGPNAMQDVVVPLGGEVAKAKTYGELVTAIIHPSHKITGPYKDALLTSGGHSNMESYGYNEVMTVQELTDLVTYLQTEYELVVPEPAYY